ncbi:glycosyltransferase family 4 protein [Paenibacillus sp. MBLB4367]|uniref:glycosyltransferase family 4 protein n=1 Tax=Paenibacillus sp. MBLB4367 TaxID=3384767 RepID=UPI00390820AF
MRVVFAHDVYLEKSPDGLYFNETFNYRLWQRYLKVFDHVTVVTRKRDQNAAGTYDERKLSSGPNVDFAPVPSLSSPTSRFTQRSKVKQELERQLKDADALIARLPSEIGAMAIQIAKTMGKPYAVEVVGHPWDALWNYGSWQGKLYAPINTIYTKYLVKNAPYALYVTTRFLQDHFPSKGKTVGCSDVFIPNVDEGVLATRNAKIDDFDQQPFRIGLIGSLVNYKGIDTAIQAVAEVKKYIPNVELRVLGVGNPQPWIEIAKSFDVAENVVFSKPLPSGPAVYEWLDDLNIYIQPSRQEGLPRALVEAMSRGLPAIGSTIGGIPELLPANCLIRPGDNKQLATLIRKMYEDKEWQRRASEQSLNKAKEYTSEQLETRRTTFWRDFEGFVKLGVNV